MGTSSQTVAFVRTVNGPPEGTLFSECSVCSSPGGFTRRLKMHFGPEAYRLLFNASINLNTASDSTALPVGSSTDSSVADNGTGPNMK